MKMLKWMRLKSLVLADIVFLTTHPEIYCLSIGPARWWVCKSADEGILTDDGIATYEHFYYPLGCVGDYFPPARNALSWYLEVWRYEYD